MVKLIKKWLGIADIEEAIDDVKDDVSTTHNEYRDLYDTTETTYLNLKQEIAELKAQITEFQLMLDLLKDDGITTRADVIDEWFNGKGAEVNG